jgi:hypothetical protein
VILLVAWRCSASGSSSGGDAGTVVLDHDAAHAAGHQPHRHRRGAGIERVVDEFAHHRGRALDDLAGGDLADQGRRAARGWAAAAVLGNQTNYTIGRKVGRRVFQWEQSRWFNRRAFDQAHAFYEKYGGVTLVLARFMPFLRTFAPFVAGVAEMTRRKFTFYDVTGGTLWVGSLVTAGYLFGNVPWVQANLSKIIWAMILLPGLVVLWGAWKARRKAAAA